VTLYIFKNYFNDFCTKLLGQAVTAGIPRREFYPILISTRDDIFYFIDCTVFFILINYVQVNKQMFF